MSPNELNRLVIGKQLTLQEALTIAFQCGMDYEHHDLKELLVFLIPRVKV